MSQESAKPIIGVPDSASSHHPPSQSRQIQAEMADLDLSPDKQLALHHKRVEIRYDRLLTQRENDHQLLRELTRFQKDRFDSICNSVFSSFMITIGAYMISLSSWYEKVGWALVFCGIILGVVKLPAEALLWKFCGNKDPQLSCPECGSALVQKR